MSPRIAVAFTPSTRNGTTYASPALRKEATFEGPPGKHHSALRCCCGSRRLSLLQLNHSSLRRLTT
ncbi:hypothetical protein C8T65DRAFT_173123 [Cerioporus squamosus]|nr:hypothetical protein C8T65DRAFT_173123 [Cerioporus squamosus]